jgi:geranylgeranyl pyrophosphate synthase
MKLDPTMKSALDDSQSSQESIQTEVNNANIAVKNLEKQVESIFSLINGQVVQIKNKNHRNRNLNNQKQNKSPDSPKSVSLNEQYENVGKKVGNS